MFPAITMTERHADSTTIAGSEGPAVRVAASKLLKVKECMPVIRLRS